MTSRFNAILAAITALLLVGLIPPGLELAASLLEAFDTLGALCTGYNIRAVTNTFFLGASVALVATLLGCIIAVAIATSHGPVRLALKALFLAPIFAPSIMPAIGLIYLIGANGMLMQCELYGVTGVFLGALIFALPHATLQIQVGLTSFDARLLDVARSLGAGPFERIYSVVLPHLKPSLINGALIAFVLTVTDFGVPKLLGGSFPVLATEIYNQAIGSQNFAAAAFLSLWLLVPCLMAFYFAGRVKTHGQAQGARALVARDLGACTQAINVTACV
ncbi:MAG: ABC transporter permease subunit, partial [Candidatus Aphodousia sp.]|nr:ABC transporter permease subunit [Candidatus Aphodousia sp.]